MQKHEKWLRKWIEKGELNDTIHHDYKTWKNQVIGQCKSWLDLGLQERAMTRDLDWGVKLPIKESEGKVLYVWLDAPIGYISATKQWAKENGKNWKDYWENEDTQLIHFIGKDNIVFHCIIFPIILKSHGDFILPTNVPANEFLNLEGKKLSTSRNWAIWLTEYLNDFKGYEDSLRYTLCAMAPESKDSDFTWSEFQARNNNELVSIYGNFINRVIVLVNKYWEGNIPIQNNLDNYDNEVLKKLDQFPHKIGSSIEKFKFREGLSELINLARLGNKYLADKEPWKLKKSDEKKTETIMNIAAQIAGNLALLSEPFLPFSSKKLKKMLNISNLSWENADISILKANHKINNPSHLFNKIEDDKINEQLDKLNL